MSDKRRQGGAGTREVHNILEKNRRAHLKECFEGLRCQIPNMQDHKVSNLSILRGAFRFVQILKRKEKELEHELDRLARHKIEMQGRLVELSLDNKDKSNKKFKTTKKPARKKRVKKAERKKKVIVVPKQEEEDDGASTSTASEAEEEERKSRAQSPISGTLPLREPKPGTQLQVMLTTSNQSPRSMAHASVIHSTGQPKQPLKVVPRSAPVPPCLPTAVVAGNGHSASNNNGTLLATDNVTGLRPTVSQLLNNNPSVGKIPQMNVPSVVPKLHIIHTGNQVGHKQQPSIVVTQPTAGTMLTMTVNQSPSNVSNSGTSRNGCPTMLASALTGHIVHATGNQGAKAKVSGTQSKLTSSLITTAVGQSVMASLTAPSIFSATTARPGVGAATLQAPYTQIPFNPAMTQVLLTQQPSIAAYTLSRQTAFSPTIIRQTLTPVTSKYASNSTPAVTIMTTSQKTVVSPKSMSTTASTVTKDVRMNQPTTAVIVPASQTINVPHVFPTTYLQTIQPGVQRLPIQQPTIQTTTSNGTPVLKAYHSMYIPRFRTIGSVINNQRPIISGNGVGPKMVTQAGNGNTATFIVQPTLVNTVEKQKH
ncbi:uncharacterized protein [Antedon mediterranea]